MNSLHTRQNESNCWWMLLRLLICSCLKWIVKKTSFFQKTFYKIGASFSKELLTCRLEVLEAAEFLDSCIHLTFNYWRNDGYFTFNAISVYKVYIDFRIKILGRFFVNDKQILTECFKSFLTLQGLVVTKAHNYLKLQVCLSMYDLLLLPGVKGLRRFPASYKFLDNFIEIWIKFTLRKSEKGSPKPRYFQGSCIYVLRIALNVSSIDYLQ